MDKQQLEMQDAIKTLLSALPEGWHAQAIAFRPQVGYIDAGAGTVHALIISESADDLKRASQVIKNGIVASAKTPGLVDAFLRETVSPAPP